MCGSSAKRPHLEPCVKRKPRKQSPQVRRGPRPGSKMPPFQVQREKEEQVEERPLEDHQGKELTAGSNYTALPGTFGGWSPGKHRLK